MTLAALDPWLPMPLLLLLLLAFVGFPVWVYRRRTPALSPRALQLLLGLRIAAVVVLFMVLLRPMRVEVQRYEEKPQLALLVDASRSMTLRDMPEGRSRAEALARMWSQQRGLMARLEERFELAVHSFGAELGPAGAPRFSTDADATGIGPALRGYWRDQRRGRLVAAVVFSDGHHNHGVAPRQAVGEYKRAKVPVHAVLVGSTALTRTQRDLALVDLIAPASVDRGHAFEATVELRALAAAGERVEVTCTFAGKLVGRRALTVPDERHRQPLRFEVPTRTRGTFPLVVTARPLDGERNTANNVIRTEVRVTSRKLLVLLLEGVLRWETTFLRRALAGDPGISLVVGYTADPATRRQLGDPAFGEQFDVLILGDVAPDDLPADLLAGLPGLITTRGATASRGRGLVLLAGQRSLSGSGWSRTPVAPILPVVLADAPSRLEGEVRARPTQAGERHFALRLHENPARSRRRWEKLAPLLGAEQLVRVKPTGTALLTAPRLPLLVTAPYGLGRVAVLASASTWRWAMAEDPDGAADHRRFWRQLMLWAAKRDERGQGKMWLQLSPRRGLFKTGDRVRLEVQVMDGDWQPDPGADVSLVVTAPDGKALPFRPRYDPLRRVYAAPFEPSAPGEYVVRGQAARGQTEIGKDTLKFKVRARASVELEQPMARPEVLADLAARSGGRMVGLDGAPSLLQSLLTDARPTRFELEQRRDRWDHGGWLVLLVALLGAEWLARKKLGLV